MSNSNSRFPGFYRMSVEDRQEFAARALECDVLDLREALQEGGLDESTADKTVENVIGTFSLPFALALNVQMNGHDYLVPMVVEEPSVVAACSNAAKMIRASGGFQAEADLPIMIAQVQIDRVANPAKAQEALAAHKNELLTLADKALPGLVARGGGARDIETRVIDQDVIVVHVLVDCRDAMGANLVNTVAEQVAPRVAEIASGRIGLRILSNLCDHRLARVNVRVSPESLASGDHDGESVRDAIVRASRFAERDPYRAATHNKGVMNGVDAVVLATGNDWRAAEAGAHAFAARNGRYEPLCTWRVDELGYLCGSLEMPLALGIVGGPSRVHRGAQLAIEMTGVETAQELAMLAASAGLASNLAALRALVTDGIQSGHMLLHARSVAIAAGARGAIVEVVAAHIHAASDITIDAARRVLSELMPSIADAVDQNPAE